MKEGEHILFYDFLPVLGPNFFDYEPILKIRIDKNEVLLCPYYPRGLL